MESNFLFFSFFFTCIFIRSFLTKQKGIGTIVMTLVICAQHDKVNQDTKDYGHVDLTASTDLKYQWPESKVSVIDSTYYLKCIV